MSLYFFNSLHMCSAVILEVYINTLPPKLNFTLETEINNTINFLDLIITKTDNKHIQYIQKNPHHNQRYTQNFKSFHTT